MRKIRMRIKSRPGKQRRVWASSPIQRVVPDTRRKKLDKLHKKEIQNG